MSGAPQTSSSSSSSSSTSRSTLNHHRKQNSNYDNVHEDNAAVVELKHAESVQEALRPHQERHQRAQVHRDKAKQACARELAQLHQHHRLVELQADSRRLRSQLQQLKAGCANMAVRVASRAVENDSKQEESSSSFASLAVGAPPGASSPSSPRDEETSLLTLHYESLERLEGGILETSMQHAIQVATQQVRAFRFQWARKAMAMHRLVIDPEDVKPLSSSSSHKPASSSAAGTGIPASQQPHLQRLRRRARGIGKIGGLPLPHAGPELYGVLPPRELQSALRLVASVTWMVARCLGIVLPHPILLTPHGTSEDIAAQSHLDNNDKASRPKTARDKSPKLPASFGQKSGHHAAALPRTAPTLTSAATSAASLFTSATSYGTSLLKKGAKKAYSKATGYEYSSYNSDNHRSSNNYYPSSTTRSISNGHYNATYNSPYPYHIQPQHSSTSPTAAATTLHTPTMTSSSALSLDRQHLNQRIHHATAAVICDDATNQASAFSLTPDKEDDFAIALQLLQNNIICLCIRAGVPVAQLWPAEAILLNLYALDLYCQRQIAVEY